METYKLLMIIPAILLVLSLAVVANNFIKYGSFMDKDVELTGGMSVTLQTNSSVDVTALENAIPGSTIRAARGIGSTMVIIQTKDMDEKKVLAGARSIISFDESSVEMGKVEPSIGNVFWTQAQIAMIMAFVLMSIIVLILFRSLVPSFTVIFCVVADMIMTVATISLFEVKLSLPIFAGLLMLIGYSVDTDILLTTRAMKGVGELKERINSSIKTGLTMTTTCLAAVISMYLFSHGTIIQEIATVLIVGLVFDMINTWITNVGILRMWLEHKEKK